MSDKVSDALDAAEKAARATRGSKVIAACVIGSQNYGTDLPDSDVDVMVLTRPTLDGISDCSTPESYEIVLGDGHAVVKDFRKWLAELKRGGVETLQTLFSCSWDVTDDTFQDSIDSALGNAEAIARVNQARTACAIVDTMVSRLDEVSDKWESISERRRCKCVSDVMRLSYMARWYANGFNFAFCLHPSHEFTDAFKTVKRGEVSLTSYAALNMCRMYHAEAERAERQMSTKEVDGKVIGWLDDLRRRMTSLALLEAIG